MRKVLSKAQILEAKDLTFTDVPVPEWGGAVRLRELSAEEALGQQDALKGNQQDALFQLLVMSATDDDGNALFTEEDIPALKKKSLRVFLQRLQPALMGMLKALTADGVDEAKNDSGEAGTDASRTDSPSS